MRALAFAVVVVSFSFSTSAALAQTLCAGTRCPDGMAGFCLAPFDGAPAVCVPAPCATGIGTTRLADACFEGPGVDSVADFAQGDCDGDLIRNGLEPGAICDGGVVVRLSPTGGSPAFVERQRLAGLDAGGYIAPGDARSPFVDAIGIACSTSRPCPRLADDSLLAPRCVFLVEDGMEERGVCTYYVEPRGDHSCVLLARAGEVLPASCVAEPDYDMDGILNEPHERWEHGDCDGDGLINKLDNAVCDRVSVVGVLTPGQAACVPGRVLLEDGDCSTPVADVTSTRQACASDPTNVVAPFGFCCTSHEDCPIEDLDPPFDEGYPRCVRLATFGGDGGICTYNGGPMPDDTSCVRPAPVLPASCLTPFPEVPAYQNWVDGNCDACDDRDPNRTDRSVCACMPRDAGVPPVEDAGGANIEDGGSGSSDDGGNASLEDAALSDQDAGPEDSMDADVEPPPPPSVFSGSGCRCAAAGTKGSASALPWLVVAALVLGTPLLRRRKR